LVGVALEKISEEIYGEDKKVEGDGNFCILEI
jgi:hypothetical protein